MKDNALGIKNNGIQDGRVRMLSIKKLIITRHEISNHTFAPRTGSRLLNGSDGNAMPVRFDGVDPKRINLDLNSPAGE